MLGEFLVRLMSDSDLGMVVCSILPTDSCLCFVSSTWRVKWVVGLAQLESR